MRLVELQRLLVKRCILMTCAFFTKEESAQLMAAARSPDVRLLLMFALHIGARAGERLALQPRSSPLERVVTR
jgi:hypothetical protein